MIFGIDLGTTNSLIGAMESGFPVLCADAEGSRLTPSAVWFPEGGEPVVGREALARRAVDPGRVVTSIKRLMGCRFGDVGEGDFGGRVVRGEGGLAAVRMDGRDWLPEEISALILRKLLADARRVFGVEADRAVITVPAYFNDAQRAATLRAGELAGLRVERLVAEPTAAALAYGLDRRAENTTVVVYDLGGGTFDVSALVLSGGVFQVLATHGDTRLGGDDMDAAIAAAHGVTLEEAARRKKADRSCDALCLPIIDRTRALCRRVLFDAKIGRPDAVVLAGGATRMPLVREVVADIFGLEPDASQHPDEVVALGATIQGGVLAGAVANVTLLDVTPLSLGIETFGGLMNVLIPRNTTIPCRAGEMFANAAANQTTMRIRVLQGEREMARDNWKLGEFDVAFTPAPRGQARVGVQFTLDANGILHVLARDVATGRDEVVEIKSAVEVSDEAVEKMLGDSLEHAFVDMDDRQFAEAVLKADEMLPAVEVALEKLGSTVPDDERAAILTLVGEVRAAMADRSLSRLKKSLSGLDAATEPLAAKLIESLIGSGAG